jgi:hypothetical protein
LFEPDGGGFWLESAKLVASNGAEDDGFGDSVAIEGTILVVGAGDSDALGENSGAAYVFEDDGASWSETAQLVASDGGEFDAFGEDVALSGETIVVGSKLDDESDLSAGAAFIFERNEGGTWVESEKIVASDGDLTDFFGEAIGISGGTIVAGASNDDDFGSQSGAAYVFEKTLCQLTLALGSTQVRRGEELTVTLRIEHNRQETVSVPFRIWIEDQAGALLLASTTPHVTLRHGDRLTRAVTLAIPDAAEPGMYRVLTGIYQMQQGLAADSSRLRVTE